MVVTAFLAVLSRWLHLATACVAVGGVFYFRVVLPIALRGIDADPAAVVWRRANRSFKFVVHACVLFTLVSGTYNAVLNWPAYTRMGPGVGHGLFGLHLLLGLGVLGLLLWLFVGREPRATAMKWLAVVLGLMFLTTAAAAVLKYAREKAMANPPPPPVVAASDVRP